MSAWYYYTRYDVRCAEAFGSLDAALHAADLDQQYALSVPYAIVDPDGDLCDAYAITARHDQQVRQRLT